MTSGYLPLNFKQLPGCSLSLKLNKFDHLKPSCLHQGKRILPLSSPVISTHTLSLSFSVYFFILFSITSETDSSPLPVDKHHHRSLSANSPVIALSSSMSSLAPPSHFCSTSNYSMNGNKVSGEGERERL